MPFIWRKFENSAANALFERACAIFYEWLVVTLMISSNIGFISYRFWDMASYPLKNAHFPLPLHSTLILKSFLLHKFAKILHA